ncbi:MAG: hypothetical protein Q4F13_06650 [Pseudomonadota bacterium]|nr:hypothetical protein [Pseudomonadota bacterium]
MRTIEIFRLRRVRDKPRALSAIVAHTACTPAQAQAALHAAIGGGQPVLALPHAQAARDLIETLAATGFVARFAPAPDFDAAQCAYAALHAVQPLLPAAVSDAVGAWLLQEQWPQALMHALQHLRQHAPGSPASRLLARTAIETGLVAGPWGRA